MKKIYLIVLSVFLINNGCISTNPQRNTPSHMWYIYNSTKGSLNGTEKEFKTIKIGKSTSHGILLTLAWGDSSIEAAMQNGKIKKILYIDYDHLYWTLPLVPATWIPIYERFTTIVYGE